MPKTDCTFASSARPRRHTATRSTSERDFRTGRWLATAHQPAPTTPTRNLPLMRILPWSARSSVTPRLVFGDHHGGDQQHALCDHLIERRHARQDHAVVEHADYQHPEHAPDDRSL